MLAEQRRRNILEELELSGSISVAELSEKFRVSDMTIRRDLDALSARSLLRKVHGGAVRISKAASEPHFVQKWRLYQAEKQAIAREAVGLVEPGDTVAFSAGTTTWTVAAALGRESDGLTFITNSVNVASKLQEGGHGQIILSGGIFRTPSDALVGAYADKVIGTLNADILFLGVHGLHPEAGLTTPNVAEAETNGRLVGAAQRVVVVADHSKLGVVALAQMAPLSEVDVLITDDGIPRGLVRELESAGVEVIAADTGAA